MERSGGTSRGVRMEDKQTLLSELHRARLDRLKEICAQHGISKNGSVEVLRAKLIAELVLDEWDLSPEGIMSILNNDLGDVLAVFGVKNNHRRSKTVEIKLLNEPNKKQSSFKGSINKVSVHQKF